MQRGKLPPGRDGGDEDMLDRWVEAGWLVPHRDFSGKRFSDVDVARARLIRDLQDVGVNDDSIPIVLDLIDQVHGLRNLLRQVLLTVEAGRRERGGA